MRSIPKGFTAAAICTAMLSMPALAQKAGENMDADHFVKMCDADKDGMVSKAEVMKQVEKMFDKADSRKMGKLDKKQVEFFLQELMKSGG